MVELAELPEELREQAMARFRLLEPHLTQGRELRSVAAGCGVSFRTLQRWVTQYRQLGLAALVRRPREDRGGRRVLSPRMKAAIEGLALEKPPLPISSVHRQICQFARQVEETPPSYATVLSVARALPKDLRTLAHPWLTGI
jgi:putative transposase